MPVTASSQEKTEEEPSSEVRFRERERDQRERSERYSRRGRRTQRGGAPMLQSSLGWALRQGVLRRDR